MISNFYPEEQIILNALSQYECLKKEQLVQLLYKKDREVALKIINGLQKGQYILIDKDSDQVKSDPRCDYDFKREMAFWVLLKFIDKVKPEEHYAATYPSEIYFLKEGKQYEIIVIDSPNDEYLLNIIAKNHQAMLEEEDEYDDETKYIIAIPDESMIPSCSAKMKDLSRIFAVYSFSPTADTPDIHFEK